MPVQEVIGVAWSSLIELIGIAKASVKKVIGIDAAPSPPDYWSPPMVQNVLEVGYSTYSGYGGTKPTLTSNTHYSVEGAFDDDYVFNTGRWEMLKTDLGAKYGQVQLAEAVTVKRIMFYNVPDYSRAVRSIKVSASNDGSNWTVMSENIALANSGWTTQNYYDNTTAYAYWRFEPLTHDGDPTFANLIEIAMLGDAEDYPLKLNTRVPTGAWSWYGGLNGTLSDCGLWRGSGRAQWSVVNGGWLKYDFEQLLAGNAPIARSAKIRAGSVASNRCPRAFKIQGSNDDSNWTDLYDSSVSGEYPQNQSFQTFNFTTTGSFRYYKMIWTTNWGGSYVMIDNFHLYSQTF